MNSSAAFLTPPPFRTFKHAARKSASAHDIFNAPGLVPQDKAYAAFVVANAFFQANDRRRGCEWVRTATELDSLRESYRKLLDQCQR